ncbi:hypothetical protein CcaverHIS002_0202540 [Cutaneotrichosporon cavernicola]|uniref:Amino acid transporter transmembrane domain-containing protein n=1 Tax=Cutaneotrichosporon cavernicola TaxID=279322 RepID=A0AA48IIC6_9TREE|nr:uncharacterized protein CcaverHIS019_0202550 [Cutaneotrichosporon cavernicola]BEI81094.1 hypothetical protein CcaverHIS002_0202540 [Cutaneotrichosporon cavernicola]BEI88893.1 hypothetical protein CcaverHIS019_0202550 [Cutaneotrichosporon cavernicola]BEI96670.1 hypothetical protein CcaverHIS631_0202590 [Cutaneotrichosporon cavernicola]BEJ04442.1 hypothetical protein CcaverHIS641_0202590 [Cutaneotrichosporon cavernicola]
MSSQHKDDKYLETVEVRSVSSNDREKGFADGVKMHDEVFGDINEDGPNYRGLSDLGAIVIMTKAMIGLGILSIPFVFMAVGLVPGVIVILVIQVMMTWANWQVGQTKLRHPDVWGVTDVGRKIAGRFGEEFLSVAFLLYMVFIAGSAILAISTALNAITLHATCTAVFVAVAAIIGFMLMSIKTLQEVSWLSWVGAVSILAALLMMVIVVPLQDRPAAAPQTGPWEKDLKLFNTPTIAEALSGVSTVVFSTAAAPAFFSFAAEMKNPHAYTRCMLVSEAIATSFLVLVGSVIYYYCGQYVAVPAPGSAGVLFKRICYGIAIPGLAMSLCIYAHVAAKYIFVRTLRGTKHLATHTKRHWITWFACTGGVTIIAYIISSAIPIFSTLCSLIGALFGCFVSVCPMGLMWLKDNYVGNRNRTWKTHLGAMWAVFVFLSGVFLTIGGTYGSIVAMVNSGTEGKPWSCADNSGSVPTA